MKIVQVEDFFHPDTGNQINMLAKYMVKQGHDVTIITSEMDLIPDDLTTFFGKKNIVERDYDYSKLNGVKIIRLPLKKYISGRAVFTKMLDKTIDGLSPDILYIHGNDTLTGIKYILKSSKLSYAFITDNHMVEIASKNKFNKLFRLWYKTFITPKIIKNNIVTIRTQNDDYVEKCLGIPLSNCPWISVGSDTLLFNPDNQVRYEFRKINNINEDDFVIVYTGKLDAAKGGLLLAEAFMKKFETNKNVVVLVVGNSNGDYGEEVEKLFAASENRIIRFPTQKYIDLPKFYQAADLSVFAKQCSLSFYDAQACGLPVVSEDNNLNIDRNSNGNGLCFKSGDAGDFRNKIQAFINMPDEEYKKYSTNSVRFINENYDYKKITEEYTKIMVREIEKRPTPSLR